MKGIVDKDEKLNVWDCGSPLYDSYELVSVMNVIDRHMMMFPSSSSSPSSSVFLGSTSSDREEASKEKEKKKATKGSSCVFFSGIWSWKRSKVCDEKEEMEAKKKVASLKLSDGIGRAYNRISSLGKKKNRSV